MKRVVFTGHARDMLIERRIREEWIERTLANPELMELDPRRPEVRRAFRAIAENDGRVLRVLYVEAEDELRVVTAFFDRSRRR